jgi:hypothetical protein
VNTASFDPGDRREDVTLILTRLLDDSDNFTRRIIATIRREIPLYRTFPLDVHIADNVLNIRNLLTGLIRFAPPDEHALDHARFMGRQRALARLQLATATEAYHVAYGAVWRELVDIAESSSELSKDNLTGYVAPLWEWFHRMSGAFAASYLETEQALRATRADMHAVVHEALRSDFTADDRARRAAKGLGIALDHPVSVVVSSPLERDAAAVLNSALAQRRGLAEVVAAAPETVVLVQGDSVDEIAETLVTVGRLKGVGIGRLRRDFDSAAESYSEAVRAFACSSPHRPVAAFDVVWPVALVVENADFTEEVLRTGIRTAHTHPHLADTVLAFAENRFSLTTAARSIHLHANTTKYRLHRWTELTGWDVYSAEGLLKSLASLELARLRSPRTD